MGKEKRVVAVPDVFITKYTMKQGLSRIWLEKSEGWHKA